MARRYLIPFLSFLLTGMLAYALQAHSPSWKDWVFWIGLVALVFGLLELIVGVLLLISKSKELARQFIITAILMMLLGGAICSYIYLRGGVG